jgi:two-component system NtrC family sensor kinase
MPRLGLFARTVLLLVLLLAAGALAIELFYGPWLDRRVSSGYERVARDCVRESTDLLGAWARNATERLPADFEDLPYELVTPDAGAVRTLVTGRATRIAEARRDNVLVLVPEFRRRIERRTNALARDLSGELHDDVVGGLLLLLVAVLVVFGFLLVGTVVRSLGRLTRATERVAAGDLSSTVGLTGRDEVARLGRSFDRMTGSLRESRAEIEELNRTLENKVEQKTRELVHAETMASLGTLAGGVAHEFNNLLGGIIGTAEDARDEEDPAEVRESLRMIHATAERACVITENLLRFSRAPAPEPRETDLADLVGGALSLVRAEARKSRVEIESDLAEVPAIRVDPGQIHQVVLNLITNALHMMPDGGRLRVAVRPAESGVAIDVADTGPGVPEPDRERIFQPFFTTRESGTGLGLSVSYSIVRSHGGEITIGDADGGGAEFRVWLPAGGGKGDAR